jgi:hypothetical protein
MHSHPKADPAMIGKLKNKIPVDPVVKRHVGKLHYIRSGKMPANTF